jgi:hypothetical protein
MRNPWRFHLRILASYWLVTGSVDFLSVLITIFVQEGHYYRFDREQKYDHIRIQDGGLHEQQAPSAVEPRYDVIGNGSSGEAEELMDDALVKLQSIERSLLELSQQTLHPHDVRNRSRNNKKI